MNMFYKLMACPRLLVLGVLLITISILPPDLDAQESVPNVESLLSNNLMGTEFWLAIPPSEGWGGSQSLLEIYVASWEDTEVMLDLPRSGQSRTLQVKAGKLAKFSSKDNSANWAWEVRNSEQVQDLGIRIVSEKPISVQAVTAKSQASDGFSVFPVTRLGSAYRHLSYYDSKIGFSFGRAGGFLVVATEDNTSLNIQLLGRGSGKTAGGKKVGDRISNITLQKGQVYMVRGSAEEPSGTFDLSSSLITSSKPVALISFHQQAIVPAPAQFQMGTLSEMVPPLSNWSKKYISLEFQGSNQGTYYRLMASEPNTGFTVRSYDQNTGSLIANKSGTLTNAGDMAEYEEVNPQQSPNSFIQGVAVWEADKPVMLMQYSFGSNWASGRPYMISVPPVDQTVHEAIFQIPNDASGSHLHLLARGDSSDPENKLLRSYTINGDPVVNRYPRFITNRIAGTNIYWAAISIQGDVFRIKGDARFSGYVYGNISFGGYGFPIGMAGNSIAQLDTLPPQVSVKENCNVYTLTFTEEFDGNRNDVPRQLDQGIAAIKLLEQYSQNVQLTYKTAPKILAQYEINKFVVEIELVNKLIEGTATYAVMDRAGNIKTGTIHIPPLEEYVELSSSAVGFNAVRVGQSSDKTVQLLNPTENDVTVTAFSLKSASVFQIVESPTVPFVLESGGSVSIKLKYLPTTEDTDGTPDIDTIVASTGCNAFVLAEVSGRGVLPHIQVVGWDAGEVQIKQKVCNEAGISITNTGTGELTVTGISSVDVPFSVADVIPAFPFKISPGSMVMLRNMCFEPTEEGDFSIQVVLQSDAEDGAAQHTSLWKGKGIDTTTVINDVEQEWAARGYYLGECRPNPAVENAVLEYAIGEAGDTRLELVNLRGETVQVLLDAYLEAGSHRITISTAGLNSGTYYCRIVSGAFTFSRSLKVLH